MAELAALGWDVRHVALPEGFPFPDAAARVATEAALADLPAGALAVVDGLAFGASPETMRAASRRLRLVALVHHPLGDESGLSRADAEDLWARETAALRAARLVVCTSPATAARLEAAFEVARERLVVAPPGTAPAPRAAGAGDPPLILSVGSLIPRKRHDVLLDAFAALRGLSWRARIVGSAALDPACAAALANQAATLGLGERVTFVGAVTDTRREMARADLFALASEYEGYGMAFAEALAQGLPVVACRAGAIADLVPEAAGALVRPGDPGAFAAALEALLTDGARRRTSAEAAWAAGVDLPGWEDTGRIVAAALARAAA